MPGASGQTSQVRVLNANWIAGPDGEDPAHRTLIAADIVGTYLEETPAGIARVAL